MITLTKPLIAVAVGDPCGIGPELAVRLAHRCRGHDQADIVLVGDRHVIRRGEMAAGIDLDPLPVNPFSDAIRGDRPVLVETDTIDQADVTVGRSSTNASRSGLAALTTAIELAEGGAVAGVISMPISDTAPGEAGTGQNHLADFIGQIAGLGRPTTEIAAMTGLWVTSVAGKVPMTRVPELLSENNVLATCKIVQESLRAAGLQRPRIAVTGINPIIADAHGGAREELEILAPALARAKEAGIDCEGPYTAETVFKEALSDGIDAVITMYHDQARIAASLMGFERGLVIQAGLPFPLIGPAGDPRHELAGKGKAETDASIAAFNLALAMSVKRGSAFRFRGDTGRARAR